MKTTWLNKFTYVYKRQKAYPSKFPKITFMAHCGYSCDIGSEYIGILTSIQIYNIADAILLSIDNVQHIIHITCKVFTI